MSDWPIWIWALLIMQFSIAVGIYKLERGIEHVRNLLLRLQHLDSDPEV